MQRKEQDRKGEEEEEEEKSKRKKVKKVFPFSYLELAELCERPTSQESRTEQDMCEIFATVCAVETAQNQAIVLRVVA